MKLNLKRITDKPGVYILKNRNRKILYIGKALNLRNRLKSYQRPTDDPRVSRLIEHIFEVDTLEVNSEIEALILEANLIKKYKPEFNVQLKDDKDYLYIIFTRDKFPKVLPARRKKIADAKEYFGPFPSATTVRRTLKTIRRIFPYSTCKPSSRVCLHYHLGLCPGVCVGKIGFRDYKKNIKNLRLFLNGKKQKVIHGLEREMKIASKKLKFEEAEEIRKKLNGLNYVTQPRGDVTRYMEDPEFIRLRYKEDLEELKSVLNLKKIPGRIEGYDISNIHGEYATGSMVVITDGEIDKSEYKKFKIKRVKGISDTAMMKEIISRRFNNDWRLPDLIVVDGGKGQLSSCLAAQKESQLNIPCLGLAKRLEQIYIPGKDKPLRLPRDSKALHLLQRLRDEAHRFAISYHRNLRGRELLTVQNTFDNLIK